MEEIKIISLEDLHPLTELRIDAYPAFTSPQKREEMLEKLQQIQTEHPYPYYGYYRDGQLLGAMRLFDFTMNLYGKETMIGGLASVAVSLLHKKEQIAKKMVEYFLHHYRNKRASFTFLYAFRPDFYKKMGFGFGTRTFDYHVHPSTFPRGNSKKHLNFLTHNHIGQCISCHNRLVDTTHGMIRKTEEDYKMLLDDPKRKIIGYQEGKEIAGYMIYSPQKANSQNVLTTHLVIHEWVYENTEVLHEFMTFLHSQADQFERIIFQTQDDEFYYLLDDPRNHTGRLIPSLFHESHSIGIGMMPRIINPHQAINDISHRIFGEDELTIQFHVTDTFLNENTEVPLSFKNGACMLSSKEPDVHLYTDIANYSSLLFGAVSLKSLYMYGLITLSDESYASRLIDLFSHTQKPICTLSF